MRVLHYTLGLPPYKSGGLTKYATDLMLEQAKKGLEVNLLYPGNFKFWKSNKMEIVNDKNFKSIKVYQIVNPSPVPLLHGVSTPKDIYNNPKKLSVAFLDEFYNKTKPDVLHIHTLMGLPLELVQHFKYKGVKIIFTSHDYYGLCPKVNFINEKNELCKQPSGENCFRCNVNAPSSFFLKLRNSTYLLKYKTYLAKLKTGKTKELTQTIEHKVPQKDNSKEYTLLLDFYLNYFKLVDCFHFNSKVTNDVYSNFITPKNAVVIPITHSNVSDKRVEKNFSKFVRLGFIGSTEIYKGYPMLKDVLKELQQEGFTNWSLNVWGNNFTADLDSEKISFRGLFSANELKNVFDEIDILVVPSIWKETFSLITLEALSFGVPVLLTSNVGAKDLVLMYDSSFVVSPTKLVLKTKIKSILEQPIQLSMYNKKILENKFNHSMDKHEREIKSLYTNLIS